MPYLALSLVKGIGQHPALNRQVCHAKGGHQTLDAIAPKDSEQIVLQRQEVTGAARVSLPAAQGM